MKKLLLVILACLSIASCTKKSALDGTSWFGTILPEGLTERHDFTIVFASNDKAFVLDDIWNTEKGEVTQHGQQSGTYHYDHPNITISCPVAKSGWGGMNALTFTGKVNGNQMTVLMKGGVEDVTITLVKN